MDRGGLARGQALRNRQLSHMIAGNVAGLCAPGDQEDRMQQHGIAIVHSMGRHPSVLGFCVDAPRHRETVDLTRTIRLVGWVAFDPAATGARLLLRTDKATVPVPLDIARPDVARRRQTAQNPTVPVRCGFDIAVPAFEEAALVVTHGPDQTNVLAALSLVPLDIVSEAANDRLYLHDDVPRSEVLSHATFWKHALAIGNRPGGRVLEVGSRAVTAEGKGPRGRERFDKAEYVGFDYYPGKNVDVVGDAHRLSSYFDAPFDLIVSFAVFEHFAMPWVVAMEMAKCLKVGGLVAVETHFSFSSHERPWHFFQFSDMALRVLFSPALGFHCLEAGASNPIVGRFSSLADPYLRGRPVTGLYCHSEILAQKERAVPDFDWARVDLDTLVGDLRYPLLGDKEEG